MINTNNLYQPCILVWGISFEVLVTTVEHCAKAYRPRYFQTKKENDFNKYEIK